jgi:OTU domain-containing protein 3
MREHAAYYKQFIDVQPGGGTRRNPKRKNAGAYSTSVNLVQPSNADIDRVFNSHLQSMAKGGTYGDNMEITAFSSALGWDVKIYQRDFAYMISGAGEAGRNENRPVAHIAYHAWEHYSSIRNLGGPYTGLPVVSPKALSLEEEAKQREMLASTSPVQPWMIDQIANILPFLTDKPTIRRALEAANGNVDRAFSALMDAEENRSGSSAQESSSVERDQDSEDDVHAGPNKKQDRRMSRASKKETTQPQPHVRDARHALSHLLTVEDSQDSAGGSEWADSDDSSAPESTQQNTIDPNTSFGMSSLTTNDKAVKKESESPTKPTIRLKLHGPKPPPNITHEHQQHAGKTSQRQPGPRVSARDKKDIKKQAQKAARKERAMKESDKDSPNSAVTAAGLALRQNGLTQTPPVVDTLRTLYI